MVQVVKPTEPRSGQVKVGLVGVLKFNNASVSAFDGLC